MIWEGGCHRSSGDPPVSNCAYYNGIGFGDHGDNHVGFALIENEERTRQALRGIKQMLAKGVVPAVPA